MALITKRRLASLVSASAMVATLAVATSPAAAFAAKADPTIATIKSGTILAATGEVIVTGTDQFGYNYGAHSFNGTYDSIDRNLDGLYYGQTGDYVDDHISMKWSDDWLANVDTNGDHKLDRGLADGKVSGISQGWTTNHIEGDYDSDGDGTEDAAYTIYDKIAYVGEGGPLWGYYKVVQSVVNDPAAGLDGLQFKEPKSQS